MFRKSGTESQMDLFSSPEMFLGKRANKSYTDPRRWHNVLFKEVTSRIDEGIFSVLYKEGNIGAPTASVRVLVAMSILKEGFGCSDEDLFEKVEFDLLVRKAVGLASLDDVPPSLDTYYLFNRRLCEYYERTGKDLMEQCFNGITGQQIRNFNISGKSVRMDKHRRNNIEAAMFQYSFHTRNNKTRYRGRFKHSLQAIRRCAWMNMRRLTIYMAAMTPEEYERVILSFIREMVGYVERKFRSVSRHIHFNHYFGTRAQESLWRLQF